MATTITDVDDFGDVDLEFLSQIEAAEAEAVQALSFKRRRTAAASPPLTVIPADSAANVKPTTKLEKEGAYTAALKGRGVGGISVSNATASSTVAGGGSNLNGGGSCFKCGKEGHWARDCGGSVNAIAAAGGGDGLEKSCPCGTGMCLVLTANTEKNRGRKFFRCPVRQESGGCGFFEWCDISSANFNPFEEARGNTGQQQLHSSYPANQGTARETVANPIAGGGVIDSLEKSCPCGMGMCLVLTANTEKNRGRKFFRCPVQQESGGCGFFEWCDKSSASFNPSEEIRGNTGQQQIHSYPANQENFGFSRPYTENKRAMPSSYGEPRAYRYTSGNLNKPTSGSGSASSSCFKCGKEGHWASECSISPSSIPSMKVSGAAAATFSSGACYKCGEPGHWARDCSSGQDSRGGYRRA